MLALYLNPYPPFETKVRMFIKTVIMQPFVVLLLLAKFDLE